MTQRNTPSFLSRDVVALSTDRKGRPHSENGPAVIYADGTVEYRLHGKLHREGDLPARVRPGVTVEYWWHGARHRRGAPAVQHADGSYEFWENDELHRIDGPARLARDGRREYFVRGRRHREAGPAFVWAAFGLEEYWRDGVFLFRRFTHCPSTQLNKTTARAHERVT